MHRLTVAILAAVDAAIAAAVGIAATLAPLTLLWIFALGGGADWSAIWPATGAVWQLGHLVPLAISLPAEYVAVTGIDETAASFTLSLAPLAFAGFTAVFAARSGARASRAESWVTGVVTSAVVFAALAGLVAVSTANDIAAAQLWQAVLFPAVVFAVPALIAAVITEWREAGSGSIARLRDRVEADRDGWGEVPALAVRGAGVVIAGMLGLGALLVAIALLLRGAEVVALFQTSNVDGLGATVMTLGQLAYLPTLVVWALSFIAGPGFAIGAGTAVSPAGTQLGVLPGIPLLGAVPESTNGWMLLLALLPIALGAFAGWVARSRLAASAHQVLLVPRLVLTAAIAVLSAGAAAILAVVASGSLGPGALDALGPPVGALALTVALEVALGAGILLLSPTADDDALPTHYDAGVPARDDARPIAPPLPPPVEIDQDMSATVELGPRGADERPPVD